MKNFSIRAGTMLSLAFVTYLSFRQLFYVSLTMELHNILVNLIAFISTVILFVVVLWLIEHRQKIFGHKNSNFFNKRFNILKDFFSSLKISYVRKNPEKVKEVLRQLGIVRIRFVAVFTLVLWLGVHFTGYQFFEQIANSLINITLVVYVSLIFIPRSS